MLSQQWFSRWSCPLVGLCALIVSGAGWFILGTGGVSPAAADSLPDRPSLVVMVMFDQLRGDYLQRWDCLFGEDGFQRLERDGAWFQNCHYPYAHTVTAAGHASILSGSWPARHGIVDNDWYDRQAGEMVNCVTSDRYQRVPPKAGSNAAGKARAKTGLSPQRMLAPTL